MIAAPGPGVDRRLHHFRAGAALVVDQSVNRLNEVRHTFGSALDAFYAANPRANRDPSKWTPEQRAAYEPNIVQNYAVSRLHSSISNARDRTDAIMKAPLSAAPNSLSRTGRK